MTRSSETWTTALARSLLRVRSDRTATLLLHAPLAWLLFIVWLTARTAEGTAAAPSLTTAAVALAVVLLLLGLTLPWPALPRGTGLVLPVLDVVAVVLVILAMPGHGHALSMLVLFPVVWMATSGLPGRWTFPLVIAACGLVALLAWLGHPPATPSQTVLSVLMPLVNTALAVCIHAATAHQREQDRLLAEQRAAVEHAAGQSRRSEELLRAGLAALDVGILVIDEHGRAMTRNVEMDRLLAVAAPEDPAVMSDLAASEPEFLVHGGDCRTPVPAPRRPVARALAGEDFSHQLLWLGAGEDQRAVSVTARAVRDGPAHRGSVLAFTDVTDLIEAVGARDQLLSTVSHDLRSPLSAILGRADLVLERGGLPERTQRDLVAIIQGAEHLQSIVQDLLHSTSGAPQATPRPTDLAEIIRETAAAAEHAASGAAVELSLEVPARLPALVDPIRMRRVLDNLFVNAIKYSPVGGRITVRARATTAGGRPGTETETEAEAEAEAETGRVTATATGRVTATATADEVIVEVEDRGRGMTEAEAQNAFDRFYRAESARHGAVPGVGLGLYICKSIVEAHGGTISCRSRPNEGSTFTVRLPGAPEDPDGAQPGPGTLRSTSAHAPGVPTR